MEVLHSAPDASSFVLLAEHQSQTPASFYSGPPVLHYHSRRCKVVILERDLLSAPALNALRGRPSAPLNGNATIFGGQNAGAAEKEVVIDGVDVWVTSDKFLLYVPTCATGVSIPYPSISLHAIQRLRVPADTDETTSPAEVQGLYMQIASPRAPPTNNTPAEARGEAEFEDNDDDEEPCITMTIIPPPTSTPSLGQAAAASAIPAVTERVSAADVPEETPTQQLYAALSACSNLHPDPAEPGDPADGADGDGELWGSSLVAAGLISAAGTAGAGLPPALGGSGWITADNMHEYFDEEGNWIGGGEGPAFSLGAGAGSVRKREDEGEDEGEGAANGDGGEETKWRRTD